MYMLTYLRKALSMSFFLYGRIPSDTDTNAMSSPGIIFFLEFPSYGFMPFVTRSSITFSFR